MNGRNMASIIKLIVYMLSSAASGKLQIKQEYENNNKKDNVVQNNKKNNKTFKKKKVDHLRHFTLRHELSEISVVLQTALAAETYLAEGRWPGETERGRVAYVPSGNTNADCFEDRGTTFSGASKDIY
jgi:hypothetical protein